MVKLLTKTFAIIQYCTKGMQKRKRYGYLKETKHQEPAGAGSMLELKFLQGREMNSKCNSENVKRHLDAHGSLLSRPHRSNLPKSPPSRG